MTSIYEQKNNELLHAILSTLDTNQDTTKRILAILTEVKEQQKETNQLLKEVRDQLRLM